MNCFRCVQIRQYGTVNPPPGSPSEAVCHLYMETSPTKLKLMCRECMNQFMQSYTTSGSLQSSKGPAYELPLEDWEEALAVVQVMES